MSYPRIIPDVTLLQLLGTFDALWSLILDSLSCLHDCLLSCRQEPEAAQQNSLDKRVVTSARVSARFPDTHCGGQPAITASVVTVTFMMGEIKQKVSASASAAAKWIIKSMTLTNTGPDTVAVKIVSQVTNAVICHVEAMSGYEMGCPQIDDIQQYAGHDVFIYVDPPK